MTDRYDIIEQIDWRLDHEVGPALARALNGEAHNIDPAERWQHLATELRTLADMADQLATGAASRTV